MQTSTWLRTAAVVTALLALGHTLGHPWTPVRTLPAEGVVAAMQAVHFTVEGASRSYFDFYQGFGWTLSALIAMLAVVEWRLASAARDGRLDRLLVGVLAAGFALSALASALFIAILPASFSGLVALSLIAALLAPTRARG